jgi:prepilin-type N-terminal cleavage/methylation domain-containing protein
MSTARQQSDQAGDVLRCRSRVSSSAQAFSLIELLVVIGLIALIAGLAAPALKTKSVSLDIAHRQLADDLNRARQLAISTRSTVYVLFVPLIEAGSTLTNNLPAAQKDILASRQARGYALFSRRSVGSQPGQEEPRYLSEWKELPDGVFISTNKFQSPEDDSKFFGFLPMDYLSAKENPTVKVPSEDGSTYKRLPYIAFDSTGALTLSESGYVRAEQKVENWRQSLAARAVIPLVAGSVAPARKDDGFGKRVLDWAAASILVKAPFDPNGNFLSITNYIKRVTVDPLSGRSRVEGGEIQ